jgi:hypothetical protein
VLLSGPPGKSTRAAHTSLLRRSPTSGASTSAPRCALWIRVCTLWCHCQQRPTRQCPLMRARSPIDPRLTEPRTPHVREVGVTVFLPEPSGVDAHDRGGIGGRCNTRHVNPPMGIKQALGEFFPYLSPTLLSATAVAERRDRNPPSSPLRELELVAPPASNWVSGDSPVWVEAIDGSNRFGDCYGAGNRSSKPSSALDPRLVVDWSRRRLNS